MIDCHSAKAAERRSLKVWRSMKWRLRLKGTVKLTSIWFVIPFLTQRGPVKAFEIQTKCDLTKDIL